MDLHILGKMKKQKSGPPEGSFFAPRASNMSNKVGITPQNPYIDKTGKINALESLTNQLRVGNRIVVSIVSWFVLIL